MSYIPTKADEKLLAKTLKHIKNDWRGFTLVDVGSTAKGTWLRGHSDIDLYLICKDCEEKARAFYHASTVLYPKGHEKKGQLTIWNFQLNGFDVDLVIVDKAFKKREDTTKHTKFFNDNLSDAQKNEVRKAKAYLKTFGVYGAEIGGIVGVAIEQLMVLWGDFERVCKYLSLGRPEVQDPTMKASRDLLASINKKRWKVIQGACKAYLDDPALKGFQYRPMDTKGFMESNPNCCTLIFKRRLDKALDCQTLQSTAMKVGRELRNLERTVTVDVDTFVDDKNIVLCYRVRPLELSKVKEVCIDPKVAREKHVDQFKRIHMNHYENNGKICAKVERKVQFPDTHFCIEVNQRMSDKGWNTIPEKDPNDHLIKLLKPKKITRVHCYRRDAEIEVEACHSCDRFLGELEKVVYCEEPRWGYYRA